MIENAFVTECRMCRLGNKKMNLRTVMVNEKILVEGSIFQSNLFLAVKYLPRYTIFYRMEIK